MTLVKRGLPIGILVGVALILSPSEAAAQGGITPCYKCAYNYPTMFVQYARCCRDLAVSGWDCVALAKPENGGWTISSTPSGFICSEQKDHAAHGEIWYCIFQDQCGEPEEPPDCDGCVWREGDPIPEGEEQPCGDGGWDEVCDCCMGSTPILVSIDGGLTLSSQDGGVLFDLEGNGVAKRWSWPTGGDGWLAWDRNGNGIIDDGGELFGNASILRDGRKARNGFDALAQLDSNGDGRVDAQDPGFSNLRVWLDTVRDGKSAEGELRSLPELDIAAIGVSPKLAKRRDRWANTYRWRAPVFFSDDRIRFSYDIILASPSKSAAPAVCTTADSELKWAETR
jgi:hypothetical protein